MPSQRISSSPFGQNWSEMGRCGNPSKTTSSLATNKTWRIKEVGIEVFQREVHALWLARGGWWCVLSPRRPGQYCCRSAGNVRESVLSLAKGEFRRIQRAQTSEQRRWLADRPLYRWGGKNFCSRVCGASGRAEIAKERKWAPKLRQIEWCSLFIIHRQKFAWGTRFSSGRGALTSKMYSIVADRTLFLALFCEKWPHTCQHIAHSGIRAIGIHIPKRLEKFAFINNQTFKRTILKNKLCLMTQSLDLCNYGAKYKKRVKRFSCDFGHIAFFEILLSFIHP